jgi:hypothetical protein
LNIPFRSFSSSNPFLANQSQAPASGNWNPFEDTKSFGDLSEEALFGEQFDKIRLQQQEKPVQGSQSSITR